MRKLLVSACLLGEPLRYDGEDNKSKVSHLQSKLTQWMEEGRLVKVCPETMGGLPTPRTPAEIELGGGKGVITGTARVMTYDGEDVTPQFLKGAEETLTMAERNRCQGALLAARSPSCGTGQIYDGTHSRIITYGDGVTSALLQQHNIVCFTPDMAEELIEWMNCGY